MPRGRASKRKTSEENVDDKSKETQVEKKDVVENQAQDASSEEKTKEENNVSTKKRGRPSKKQKTGDGDEAVVVVVATKTTTNKRGRKKKETTTTTTTTTTASSDKKVDDAQESKDETKTTKRGRSKKSKQAEEEEEEEEEGEEEEEEEEEEEDKTPDTRESGAVLTVGAGDMAQLGMGSENTTSIRLLVIPQFEQDQQVVSVASGSMHNLVLTRNGEIYSWGCNDDGALGREGDEFTPARVEGLGNVKIMSIAAGTCHSIALSKDHRVFGWGVYKDVEGYIGFSGSAGKKSQPRPQSLPFFEQKKFRKVIQIAAGENHDLALTENGMVYEWGDVRIGQRQSGRIKVSKLEPRLIAFPRAFGYVHIRAVFATAYTSFAITDKNQVFAWGLNNYGQCGDGTRNNISAPTHMAHLDALNVVKIVGGEHHTLFLTHDHKVYSCGRHHYGRLGVGEDIKEDALKPVAITALNFSESDGNNTADNNPADTRTAEEKKADYVSDIGSGEHNSMAVTAQGYLYTWGFSGDAQLAHGSTVDVFWLPRFVKSKTLAGEVPRRILQVDSGSSHMVALARKRD